MTYHSNMKEARAKVDITGGRKGDSLYAKKGEILKVKEYGVNYLGEPLYICESKRFRFICPLSKIQTINEKPSNEE